MKVFGEFNNVSRELRPRKLKAGELVEYQLLCGSEELAATMDKTNIVKTGKVIYPVSVRIKTRDRIFDPHKKDYVDIGVFQSADKEGNIRTKAVYITGAAGLIGLSGGNIDHEELYEFLELSNENESNPNRDKSVIPKYRRIDESKDAEKRTRKRSALTDALMFSRNMSQEEVREFAAAMGWNETVELEMLEDQLGEYAQNHSQDFIDFIQSEDMKDRALIKNAQTKGILAYDTATHRVLWAKGNVLIATLDRAEGKSWLDQFTDWVKTSPNGQTVMASIKTKINAMIKEGVSKVVAQ